MGKYPSFSRIHKYPYKKGDLMNITVTGIRSRKFKNLISYAAEFYGGLLLTRRMASTVEVNIRLKNKLDGEVEGLCHYVDHHQYVREFEIDLLRELPLDTVLTNLAHEMVHLKQFALGELKGDVHPACSKWKGRSYNENKLSYWDLPWEIEANGRERGLFNRLCERIDIY